MDDFASAREKMVDSQIRTEDVTEYRVLAAMGDIPRERFVPPHLRPFAYIDDDLLLNQPAPGVPPRHLMRPAPFARLLQLAGIEPTEAVLDIGCATGYSTAVLSRLAASVIGLESDEALAAIARGALADLGASNARVVVGPLEAGYPPSAPYDVIVLGGAVEVVPDLLFAQLGENGRLVAVLGYGRDAPAVLYTKTDGDIGSRPAFDAYVRPLPGFRKPKAFVF